LRKIAAVLKVSPAELSSSGGGNSNRPQADAAELRRRAEHIALVERYNSMYPTPAIDDSDEEQDYPILSALAAYYLAGQAGMMADLSDLEDPLWLHGLPLWVRLRVSGNEAWVRAMTEAFEQLADRLESGKGYGPITNHAQRVALWLAATAAEDGLLAGRLNDLQTPTPFSHVHAPNSALYREVMGAF
jgi:hypothetical protein